jgi:hypothetical protein
MEFAGHVVDSHNKKHTQYPNAIPEGIMTDLKHFIFPGSVLLSKMGEEGKRRKENQQQEEEGNC